MDGLDLSTIEDLLNGSPIESDDDDTTYNAIRINAPIRTCEPSKIQKETRVVKRKSRSERERELELKLLNPNSIRTQILKQSLRDGQTSSEKESQHHEEVHDINVEFNKPTDEPIQNVDQPVECSRSEEVLWAEMETQEKRTDETPNDIIYISQNESDTKQADSNSKPIVESFFRKKIKSSQSKDKEPNCEQSIESPVESKPAPFLSQEDDEQFFDATSGEPQNIEPALQPEGVNNEEPENSLIESVQPDTNIEDFQCPYCFKPYSTFPLLERHVESCYLKIPIDVNKQLFKKSLPSSQEISSYFTRATRLSTMSNSSVQKTRGKRSAKSSSLTSTSPSFRPSHRFTFRPRSLNCSASGVGSNPSNSNGPKVSFYQRFIESNSQSLNKSVKVDPLQCPYCQHGFLNFSNLESHVVMCTKQKSN